MFAISTNLNFFLTTTILPDVTWGKSLHLENQTVHHGILAIYKITFELKKLKIVVY